MNAPHGLYILVRASAQTRLRDQNTFKRSQNSSAHATRSRMQTPNVLAVSSITIFPFGPLHAPAIDSSFRRSPESFYLVKVFLDTTLPNTQLRIRFGTSDHSVPYTMQYPNGRTPPAKSHICIVSKHHDSTAATRHHSIHTAYQLFDSSACTVLTTKLF